MRRAISSAIFFALLMMAASAFALEWPKPDEGLYILKDFQFVSGEKLSELRIHYLTWGQPQRDPQGHVSNAILILHSTGGAATQFTNERFAGVLFNPGQILDTTKYYIIMPDAIGHGKSSKPSDSLHAKFPAYRYADMVRAQEMLVSDHLKVDHMRLVMGMSMGCMHTWLWAEMYPTMMDGAIPLACLPVEIAGRNRMWRKAAHDAITNDVEYNHGDYAHQVRGLATAEQILALVGSSPVERQKEYPTGAAAEKYMDEVARSSQRQDGNDLAYALDSSIGYDPKPKLTTIQTPVLAINFQDDLINPPELGILEEEIKQVPHGRAIIVPAGPNTHGHGTHTWAGVWKQHLADFLQQTTH